MGPAIIARVNPKSLNMTALDEICSMSATRVRTVECSRRGIYAGTAGVMFDCWDALPSLIRLSLSNRLVSVDMIRLEVIVAKAKQEKEKPSTSLKVGIVLV